MKRKRLIIGIAFLAATFAFGVCAAYAGPTDGVVGCWKSVDEKSKKIKSTVCLTINKKDGKLYGKITKLHNPKKPNPLCTKCDGARKNKPILGMTIVWELEKGDDAWFGGRILDPEKGKTYRCKIWREGKVLKVRGYLLIFYRTQTWIK